MDEAQIKELASDLHTSMQSDRFKYDEAAIADVIRIIRAVNEVT